MEPTYNSFSTYVPKQVTKEQIDKLFEGALPNSRYGKCSYSTEKIAKVCNDTLLSLKPARDGFEFKYNAEDLEIDPFTLIHIFKDIFNAKASIGLNDGFLTKNDGLRLLTPDYQKKFQYNEKEQDFIRKLIDARYKDPNAKGEIGCCRTFEEELIIFEGFNKVPLDLFFKLIDDFKFEEIQIKELLEVLPIVKYFRLENMRLQLLDQITNSLDPTNFVCLLKRLRVKDTDIDDLLYWYLVQNEKIDFSPFSFKELIELGLKIKEFKMEEMGLTQDLLEEMKKKIEQGTFSELAELYLTFKESKMLEKISWAQDLASQMKKKLTHDWAFVKLCKDALRTKDKAIKEIVGSCFSSSHTGERENESRDAWVEMVNAKF